MSQLNERRIVYELVAADVVAMAQAARFNARQVPGHKAGSAVVFSLSEGKLNRGCFNANHVAQELPGHGSSEILEGQALPGGGPLVDNQYGLGWIRTMVGIT